MYQINGDDDSDLYIRAKIEIRKESYKLCESKKDVLLRCEKF